MDIFGMLVWLVVLISLVVFIILLVKGFKAWGTAHTILLTILFIEAWTFLFFSGSVTHQRVALTKSHDTLMEKVAKLTKQVDLEMLGDRLDPSLNLEKFVPLSNEVNRLALERGRVWRGARRQAAPPAKQGDPTLYAVQLPPNVSNLPVAPPADAANAGGGAAPAVPVVESALTPDSVVYAFGEAMSPVGLLPVVYLGEYVVVSNTNGLATFRTTAPLSPAQQAAINANETWAIYEVVPIDSHVAFAAEGSSPEEDAIFGRMDKTKVAELLGIDPALADADLVTLSGAEAAKAKLLQAYLNDGGRAPEKTQDSSMGYRITFTQDHSIDVDSREQRNAMEGGYYDLSGRSVDARLKRDVEEPVLFQTGDTYVFDASAAKELEKLGVATLGERIFIRPLNDYEFAFRDTRRLTTRARQDLLLISRELEEVNRTNVVAIDQELKRSEENRRLKMDKSQYDKEYSVISEVAANLANEVQSKTKELDEIYGSIIEFHDRIVKKSRALANP